MRASVDTHPLFKLDCLVHLAWEPVDEEATFAVFPALAAGLGHENGIHRVLDQLGDDLHRHDLSLTYMRSNKVAERSVWAVLLSAQ